MTKRLIPGAINSACWILNIRPHFHYRILSGEKLRLSSDLSHGAPARRSPDPGYLARESSDKGIAACETKGCKTRFLPGVQRAESTADGATGWDREQAVSKSSTSG